MKISVRSRPSTRHADVVELVDTLDLGSSASRRESSSLSIRTILIILFKLIQNTISLDTLKCTCCTA